MIGDALSYPSNSDDWLKTIMIGGVLTLTSVFVIPGFLLQGYFVRVLRSAARNEDVPPSFGDWEEMLIDGIKMAVISIAYVVFATIFFVLAVVARALVSDILGVILILFALVFTLALSYLIPVAQTNFALTGRFSAAFDIEQVANAGFTSQYFVAVILTVVVGSILSLISALLTLVVVGLFFLFYTQMVIYYLYGRGCGPNLHPDPQVSEPTGGPGDLSR